jgi:endonuclease/exonuclease/phosphatase family metal-dependent hydrolase
VIKSLRSISLVVLALLAILQAGCDPLENALQLENFDSGSGPSSTSPAVYETGQANLVIGSFNIQSLGKTKMSNLRIVEILVDITRRFDILAIQELRDIDQTVIPQLLEYLNQDGSHFAAAVGPRQSYVVNGVPNSYAEQAVFIFDTDTIELLGQSYVAYDHYQRMHRSPYVAHFRCRSNSPEQAFSFVLMNVHTDPDDIYAEYDALRDIIGGVYANHRGEEDFILLGDLNGEPQQFQKYRWMQQQFAAIPSTWTTNTAQTKCYDNLVFDAGYTAEYTGQSGVMNLMTEYGLSNDDARKVSDHMPVWAVFSTQEAPAAAITQGAPEEVIR